MTKKQLEENGKKMQEQKAKKDAILLAKMKLNNAQQTLDDLTKTEITEEEKQQFIKEEEKKQRLLKEKAAESARKRLKSLPKRRQLWEKQIDDFKKTAQEKNTFSHNIIASINHHLQQALNFSINNTESEFEFSEFCKAVFKEPDEN